MSGTFEWTMSFKQIQTAVQSSKELALVVNALQRERDRVVLNINNVGSNSRTLLKQSYIKTDQVFENIVHWAVERDKKNKQQYTTKEAFHRYIVKHRVKNIKKNTKDEVLFYASIIKVFIHWLHKAIKDVQVGEIWQELVAYQNIVNAQEHARIIRGFGFGYFAYGSFGDRETYDMFNKAVVALKVDYRMAQRHSKFIKPFREAIIEFRDEKAYTDVSRFILKAQTEEETEPSLDEAEVWFDSMNTYVDMLDKVNKHTSERLIAKFEDITTSASSGISTGSGLLVVTCITLTISFLLGVKFAMDSCKNAKRVVKETQKKARETRRFRSRLEKHLPRCIVRKVVRREDVEPELIESITVVLCQLDDFQGLRDILDAKDVARFLSELHKIFQAAIHRNNAYSIQVNGDRVLIYPNLPLTNQKVQARNVVNAGLDIINNVKSATFQSAPNVVVNLRLSAHSGNCMSMMRGENNGMPQLQLFGEPITMVNTLVKRCTNNRILVSLSTKVILGEDGLTFKLAKTPGVKGKQKKALTDAYYVSRLTN
ncbi:hypothetical protein NP493_131g02009 [Ridgeia piscesae]|uniref:Guanylate cyclase domain-containing protein n=1 Tax=Ridgeia piscesae TaxID=27915 RepID=A0AAD9P5E5_RIDPI|nr:hypothetical protein NP493_131g02009 [Ridgeia piscesae]